MPTYTAIITAYNAGKFIHNAIESVLAQTEPALEILVVDDGSSDNTEEAVRRFPVQYIRRPNGGPAAARNTGAKRAQGEWLAFLDHDDTWHPDKAAMQLAEAVPGIDAVFCKRSPSPDVITFLQMLEWNYADNPSGTMMRRSTFESLNGFDEDPHIIGVEDYNLWLRFFLAGHQYRTTPLCYSFTPDENHLGGKPVRMLNSGLANMDKIGKLAGLDPALIKRRKRGIRRDYLPLLIGARKQKEARAHVLKAGLSLPELSKFTIAAFSPTWALDWRRRRNLRPGS